MLEIATPQLSLWSEFDAGEFSDFREETFAESWRSLFGRKRADG